jgi:hypothetical protein
MKHRLTRQGQRLLIEAPITLTPREADVVAGHALRSPAPCGSLELRTSDAC